MVKKLVVHSVLSPLSFQLICRMLGRQCHAIAPLSHPSHLLPRCLATLETFAITYPFFLCHLVSNRTPHLRNTLVAHDNARIIKR